MRRRPEFDAMLGKLANSNPLGSTSLSRRQLLKAAGAGAAMAALPNFAGAAAARPLNMLTWEGYTDPRLLDGFTAKFECQTKPEGHVSDPTSVNRLRAGETKVWDFINVNNPWARQIMWPEKLIVDLPRDRFEPYFSKMGEQFKPPYKWAMSEDGNNLLGVVQRYETFDFIVNTDKISVAEAKKAGWDLFNDPKMAGRYGILTYDNWNVIHMCMGAGLHPFKEKSGDDIALFEQVARKWINGAKLMSADFVQLNQALINGEIDAYITGGTYTVSAARLEGQTQLYAVCPERGPADGFGGVNWIELNSAVNNPDPHPNALDFLEYILQPDSAYIVATSSGTLQPVAQMAQPEVLAKFSKEQLAAIQYDDLPYRMAHAVPYDIVPQEDKLMAIYGSAMRDKG